MHHNLSIAQFHELLDSDDCNYAIEKLNEIILNEYNACYPIKTETVSAKDRKKSLDTQCHKMIYRKTSQMFVPTKAK